MDLKVKHMSNCNSSVTNYAYTYETSSFTTDHIDSISAQIFR